MHSYHKEATVGAIVLAGIAVFLGGSLWLSGKTWNKSGLIPIYYDNIGNLKQGAPVRISGAPIGRVEDIHYVSVGRVLVTLKIDRKKVVPTNNATGVILSVGMLGDAAIDFDPGTGGEMTQGDTLHGTLGKGDLMEVGARLADKAATTLDAVNRMMDTNMVVNLRRTLNSTDRLMTYLADQRNGPTAELNTTLRAFQQTGAHLDSVITALDIKGVQANVNSAMRTADTTMRAVSKLTTQLTLTTSRIDSLMTQIRTGKGTMGKLMNDSSLYVELTKAMAAFTAIATELAKNPQKIGITIKIP